MTCLIALNVNSFAEERVVLSLSDCLNSGLFDNLDIKIAKIEARMEAEDITASRAIYDTILEGKIAYTEDGRDVASTLAGTKSITNDYELGAATELPSGTEIEIDYSNQRNWTDSEFSVDNPLHSAELSLTVRQPILKNFFGYVDRKNIKLSKVEAELADIKALERIENTVAKIEKAYWKLAYEHQNVRLRKELLEEAEKLHDIFRGHLKTGFAESNELYETEANVKIRKTELAMAENSLKSASNNLKLLLNEPGDFLIVPRDRLEIIEKKADLAKALNESLASNRSYQIKKKELAAKKIKLAMKKNSLWPEIDLVGTLASSGVDRDFGKANSALTTNKDSELYGGVELSVPLENRAARSEYNKASLEKEKAVLELIKVEKDVITDIDEKVRAVNFGLENAKRWARIKQIQYEKFEDEEKKIKYGRSSGKIIIDYQADLTRAAINEYTALLEYYSAIIDLENAKDSLLVKVGVLK